MEGYQVGVSRHPGSIVGSWLGHPSFPVTERARPCVVSVEKYVTLHTGGPDGTCGTGPPFPVSIHYTGCPLFVATRLNLSVSSFRCLPICTPRELCFFPSTSGWTESIRALYFNICVDHPSTLRRLGGPSPSVHSTSTSVWTIHPLYFDICVDRVHPYTLLRHLYGPSVHSTTSVRNESTRPLYFDGRVDRVHTSFFR